FLIIFFFFHKLKFQKKKISKFQHFFQMDSKQINSEGNLYFDRQIRIPEWKQNVLEDQVALCLGVGGVGCSVALGLVRLGIRKLFLVDRDVVDIHNLNRQILFSKEVLLL